MFVLDITSGITVILLLILVILIVFLGHEQKKSYIVAIPLFAFLALLSIHIIQLMTLSIQYSDMSSTLIWCIILDFAFIFVSFLSYLWIDDLEAKKYNKKSIDDSLNWFWKEV